MTVALPTTADIEAKVAELDEQLQELATRTAALRDERARWVGLRAALRRFSGDHPGTTRSGRVRSESIREEILARLGDGRPHRASEWAEVATDSAVRRHLYKLVDEGRIVSTGRSSYQLKPPPEASTPVRLESPVDTVRTRPAVVATPSTPALTQPLTGAAPKAPCPLCSVYRSAVGTQNGRYVYECSCGPTKKPRQYFNAGHGSDRPRGLA